MEVPTVTGNESLVLTPAVAEAWAFLEAWCRGSLEVENLYLMGPAGIGKEFLVQAALRRWGRRKTGHLIWDRLPPPEPHNFLVVPVGLPEAERKQGVLWEWARARGFVFQPQALELLLSLNTYDLDLLRSLAQRAVFQSGGNPTIEEKDILRTLVQLRLLPEEPR